MTSWGLLGVTAGYGTQPILKGVDLSFASGEIHALVGENGAGKSTALKVISGLLNPSSGQIVVRGSSIPLIDPVEAKRSGIALVHQHFLLSPAHSALDNLRLHSSAKGEFTSFAEVERKALKLMSKYGFRVPLSAKVNELGVGDQQRLEILRVLMQEADLVMLDEPSALLSPGEVEALYEILLLWKNEGKAVVVVTHKLAEVFRWCDRFTVLRKGQVVASDFVRNSHAAAVGEAMVGQASFAPDERERGESHFVPAKSLLRLTEGSSRRNEAFGQAIEAITLTVNSGEVLGVAGVEGSGQRALLECLLNPRESLSKGAVHWFGEDCRRKNRRDIRTYPIGVIPADRLNEAVIEPWTVEENFGLSSLAPKKAERISELLAAYYVEPPNAQLKMADLSGGNQQKAVAAREIGSNPRFLLASSPTRGIDFLSASRIRRLIGKLAAEGGGALIISSDLEELMEVSDRIVVLFAGRIMGELKRKEFSEAQIGRWMGGTQ
jgi:general nucleoside transport system ATP-binding protein